MSPEDAVYAPRFLHLLHQLDAPGFPSLRCYDLLVRALAPLVFSATDQEVSGWIEEWGWGGGWVGGWVGRWGLPDCLPKGKEGWVEIEGWLGWVELRVSFSSTTIQASVDCVTQTTITNPSLSRP
jgi:hypothetical protein